MIIEFQTIGLSIEGNEKEDTRGRGSEGKEREKWSRMEGMEGGRMGNTCI